MLRSLMFKHITQKWFCKGNDAYHSFEDSKTIKLLISLNKHKTQRLFTVIQKAIVCVRTHLPILVSKNKIQKLYNICKSKNVFITFE